MTYILTNQNALDFKISRENVRFQAIFFPFKEQSCYTALLKILHHSDPRTGKACLQDPWLFLVTITLCPPGWHGKAQPIDASVWENLSLSYVNTQDLLSMTLVWNASTISDIRTASKPIFPPFGDFFECSTLGGDCVSHQEVLTYKLLYIWCPTWPLCWELRIPTEVCHCNCIDFVSFTDVSSCVLT